jgi:hypothetical protein
MPEWFRLPASVVKTARTPFGRGRLLCIAALPTDSANTAENPAKPQYAHCARYNRA